MESANGMIEFKMGFGLPFGIASLSWRILQLGNERMIAESSVGMII